MTNRITKGVAVLKSAIFYAVMGLIALSIYDKAVPYGVGWNHTKSIPLGLYLTKDLRGGPIAVGAIGCFKYHEPEWAKGRNYSEIGTYICKPVMAKEGDAYKVTDNKVVLNNANGKEVTFEILKKDRKGRDMPQGALASGTVPAGSYLLLSDYALNSLDSRYLGPIPSIAVTRQIWPIWTY